MEVSVTDQASRQQSSALACESDKPIGIKVLMADQLLDSIFADWLGLVEPYPEE